MNVPVTETLKKTQRGKKPKGQRRREKERERKEQREREEYGLTKRQKYNILANVRFELKQISKFVKRLCLQRFDPSNSKHIVDKPNSATLFKLSCVISSRFVYQSISKKC